VHCSVADLCLVRLSGLLLKKKVRWVPDGKPGRKFAGQFSANFLPNLAPKPLKIDGACLAAPAAPQITPADQSVF
jgi:hypothetical protein